MQADATYCVHCGSLISAPTPHEEKLKVKVLRASYCSKCGKQVSPDATYCSYCGSHVRTPAPMPTPTPTTPPRVPIPPVPKKPRATLLKVVLPILFIIVIGLLIASTYTSYRDGGGIAEAKSLSFRVTQPSTSSDFKVYADDIGSSTMKIRVEGTVNGQKLTIIINGEQRKAWIYVTGQWIDTSNNFNTLWNQWGTAVKNYQAALSGWTSGSKTTPEGITISDIQVNPVLKKSLFAPEAVTPKSFKFRVTDPKTSSYRIFYVDNVGSSEIMIRVQGTINDRYFVMLLDGKERTAWIFERGDWNLIEGKNKPEEFDTLQRKWTTEVKNYQAALSGWTGGTLTLPDGKIISDIQVNPVLDYSLFSRASFVTEHVGAIDTLLRPVNEKMKVYWDKFHEKNYSAAYDITYEMEELLGKAIEEFSKIAGNLDPETSRCYELELAEMKDSIMDYRLWIFFDQLWDILDKVWERYYEKNYSAAYDITYEMEELLGKAIEEFSKIADKFSFSERVYGNKIELAYWGQMIAEKRESIVSSLLLDLIIEAWTDPKLLPDIELALASYSKIIPIYQQAVDNLRKLYEEDPKTAERYIERSYLDDMIKWVTDAAESLNRYLNDFEALKAKWKGYIPIKQKNIKTSPEIRDRLMRLGVIPPELASFFEQFDTDGNGRISLDEGKEFYYWVERNVKYRYDDENSGRGLAELRAGLITREQVGDGRPGSEYWQKPYETFKEGYGDCEDMAILETAFYNYFGVEAYVVSVDVKRREVPTHALCIVRIGDSLDEYIKYLGKLNYYKLNGKYFMMVDNAYSNHYGYISGGTIGHDVYFTLLERYTLEQINAGRWS